MTFSVLTPDVVDEDVDPATLPGDALERGHHLDIQPVVAANTCDALIDGRTIHRAAGHEYACPVAGQRGCDPAANAEGPPGDERDMAVQRVHGRTYSENTASCQEAPVNL
jgi:hypothetical protein